MRDYAQRIPAKRYKYWVRDDAVYIAFYRQKTGEEEAFFCLRTIGWVDGVELGETAMLDKLTERFLVAPAKIEFIRFSGTGNAIPPPRGIQISDPESKIFERYPDHRRAGRENILYDVTATYPWARPEQGSANNGKSFIGGRKDARGNWVFLYADYLMEDDTAVPLAWANPLRLEYQIKDGKIAEIYFSRSFD